VANPGDSRGLSGAGIPTRRAALGDRSIACRIASTSVSVAPSGTQYWDDFYLGESDRSSVQLLARVPVLLEVR
jgi:hypothetical protein